MKKLLSLLLLISSVCYAQTYTVGGVSSQYTYAQWGMSVILPGGGTFSTTPSASGLTLTVALPNLQVCPTATAPFGCYMYFPVNVISGANAAGVYFTQCSSTTVCSVFNNQLTSGVPTQVASPTSFGSVAGGAYTQTVGSFVTLVTIPILGNTMGQNGNFIFEQHASRASGANTIGTQAKYAGNIVGQENTATVQSIALRRMVQNMAGTGKQWSVGGTSSASDISNLNTAMGFTTVDTTVSQDLVFQGELITSATDWLVTLGGTVWVNYAP